ncbi:MAG: hypothetical protein AB9856_13725 [Cellulosilyticaceae bacterium]
MKKLVLLGIVGSMLVAGQSMVFAQSAKEMPSASLTKSIEATNTSLETMITKDQAAKIAKVLNLDSKKLEKQTMTELMKNLHPEDFNKLAKAGIIQVSKLATHEAKETMITKDEAAKIAKVLNLDSKKLEKQNMTEFMKNLHPEDFDKLAEAGIIQVSKLATHEVKETMITKDQAAKIARVLNLDSKKLEKQTMTELMKNLSKEDFNKLTENGIIQASKAVAMTPIIEANK